MATETGEGTPEESAESGGDGSADVPATDEAPLTGDAGSETAAETESDGTYSQFTRSVIVTSSATLLGMVAGIASALFATEVVGSTPQPDSLLGFAIMMATVFAQFPLYSVIGLEPEEFDTKTQLYVFAMTFFMWFITWTVLLTTRGLL
jgi:hypothetical protein